MRLRVLLEAPGEVLIPWDYRTALTRKVYELLAESDPEYSRKLRMDGFKRGRRIYRLFVYSELQGRHWSAEREGLRISPCLTWQLGSPDERFVQRIAEGIEETGSAIGLFGTKFEVVDMVHEEPLSLPSGSTFHTISPVVASTASSERPGYPIFLSAEHPDFLPALERNLRAKWEAFHGKAWTGELGIRAWNPRRKLVHVFGGKVRAWHLALQIWGDQEMITFAYDAGVGEKNSQGFGMIEAGD